MPRMDPDDQLHELDPDEIVEAYDRLGLAEVSDAELLDRCAAVVARGHDGVPDSFLLHAPLELIARAALLPHVRPEQRTPARQRIVWMTAKQARAGGDRPPRSHAPADDPAATVARLADAIAAGEIDDAVDLGGALAAATTADELVGLTAEVVVPSLSAAGHGSIFLHLLRTYAPRSPHAAAMFAGLAGELARRPDLRVGWAEGAGERPATERLDDALRAVPHLGPQETDFIAPTTGRVETSGLADELLRPAVGAGLDVATATRTILRVAAESMLVDDEAVAPYGWSHALTIPQAIAGVASRTTDPVAAIGVAASHVSGFRASFGSADLTATVEPPAEVPTIADLATDAAIHPDAHLAKYTLAALEAARTDPPRAPLYLAAAGRLHDCWRHRTVPEDPLLSAAPAGGS